MKKKGTVFVGLVAVILLLIVILLFNWQRVEKEKQIKVHVVELLNSEDYGGLAVNTAGLGGTVSLSGTMRSQESVDHAVSLIKKIDGVSDVDMTGVALKPLKPANISLRSNGQSLTLLGSTSSEFAAKHFKSQIEELTGLSVDHGMAFDSEIEVPGWFDGLAAVMPTLIQVEELKIGVRNKVLQISGISRDESGYQSIVRDTQNFDGIEQVDTSGLILKLRNPAWFSLADGELTGIFASQAEFEQLKELLSNLITVEVEQTLEIDETYAEAKWLEDLRQLNVNAQTVENTIVSYRDGVMYVSGVIRTQDVFDSLASKAPSLAYTKQLDLSQLRLRPFQLPWIALKVSTDKLVLTGGVKEAAVADALLQSVVNASGANFTGTIDNQLRSSPDFSSAEWVADIQDLLSGIARTEDGSLSLKDGVLALSGIVRDEEAFDQINTASSSFNLADQIEMSELNLRPWQTPKFAISTFGSKTIVSGSVGDDKAAKLLGEAIGLVFGENSSMQVLVNPDVTEAPWLNDVMRMMPAMTGLENASLTATNERIELSGVARTQESHELVANALTEIGTQGINNLIVLRPWQQPTLELTSNDTVLLSTGTLPNQTTVEKLNLQLEALAKTKNLTLESSVTFAPDIETPEWLASVTQAIPKLATLDMPGLRVSEGIMTLLGQTSDQAVANSAVSDMISVIDGLRIETEIAYIPPLKMQTGAGDAVVEETVTKEAIDQCEQKLDAQMEGQRIEFASSSALIDESSTPVLLSLLQELKECPEVLIEVEGHTDSSGNNAANLTLSEERAQAII